MYFIISTNVEFRLKKTKPNLIVTMSKIEKLKETKIIYNKKEKKKEANKGRLSNHGIQPT